MGRRAVLGAAAGLATAAGIAPLSGCTGDAPPATAGEATLPAEQPGILTPPPAALTLAAYDVTAADRSGLAAVLGRLATRIAASRAGTGASTSTVTLGVGASLFDGRFGLAAERPTRLAAMPAFPNDVLDPERCHGDLLLQICADTADLTRAVDDDLRRAGGAGLRLRWRIDGFRPENGRTAEGQPTTRNLFGFREGAGNPDPTDKALMRQLVWLARDDGEPEWTVGGTYQVVRLIRMATALWNADPPARQEAIFGRHRDNGAPLGRSHEGAQFDYRDDPDGRMISLDAHIRRANPRTVQTAGSRILRRGYSYRNAVDRSGHPDEGLIFVCFQRDLERGFVTVQRRLAGEALERYVLPYGGGYFFVPADGAFPGALLG